jgi:hypothetical protein
LRRFFFLSGFSVIVVFVIRITGAVVQFCQRFLSCSLQFRSFLRGGFARTPVLFPGIEDQLQPRHHLFDGGQLPWRPSLSAWSGLATRAGLTARAGFASEARLALWSGLAALALGTWPALRTGLTALALQTGFARRPGFAARTFRTGPAWMALRSGSPRLAGTAARALRSLSPLPGRCVVRHLRSPLFGVVFNRGSMTAAIQPARRADSSTARCARRFSRRPTRPAD